MSELTLPIALSVTVTFMFYRSFFRCACLAMPIVVLAAGAFGFRRGRRASSLREAKRKGFRDGLIPGFVVTALPLYPALIGEVYSDEAWVYAGLVTGFSVIELLLGGLTGAVVARRQYENRE